MIWSKLMKREESVGSAPKKKRSLPDGGKPKIVHNDCERTTYNNIPTFCLKPVGLGRIGQNVRMLLCWSYPQSICLQGDWEMVCCNLHILEVPIEALEAR